MVFIIGLLGSFNLYRFIHKKLYNQDVELNYSEDFYYKLLITEPLQKDLTRNDLQPYDKENYSIIPIKKYQVAARVLKRENYYYSEGSDVMPIDLVLGWNIMSDLNVIKSNSIKISQSNRFYFWHIPNFDNLSREKIEKNSANTHVGGINKEITEQLKNINQNDLVYLEGYLVNIVNKNNKHYFKSSVTRDDTGAGACEVLIIEKVKIL